MSIVGVARRMSGFTDIVEKNGEIIVTGVSADALSRDMKYVWTTSKVATAMFTKVSWGEVRFPSFFALEFKFILERLLQARGLYTSKRLLRALIDGIDTNTWVADTLVKPIPWVNYDKLKEIIYPTLLSHQMDFLHVYESTVPRYGLKGMLLSAAPGAGKAQPLDAKVLTPDGWKLMGELKVGDLVCTPDGGRAPIVGVYPQGVKDIYEIEFVDGRKTRACGEHLWSFIDGNARAGKPPIVKDTTYIAERLKTCPQRNHYVPLTKPVNVKAQPIPLDPYILGLLLGDGGLRHQVIFTSPDEQLVESLRQSLPETCKLVKTSDDDISWRISGTEHGQNDMLDMVRDMSLYGKYSYEKSIPKEYMESSIQDRLAVLQGLMDTDGTVTDHSTVSFCTTSETMALQVQDIVRALGGIARIATKNPVYTHNGEKRNGRLAYIVNIRHPKPSTLFRLERKKARCNDNGQYCGDVLKLAFKSITLVGKEEAQCIMVDHPDHLYITDDYIVTHNTISDCGVALMTECTKVIIVCPKNAVYRVWEKTLDTEFKVPQKPYIADRDGDIQPKKKWHIFHYETLDKAIELAKVISNEKVCIILDECHNFNEIKSLRTERFLRMCTLSKSQNIVWASGTPVKAMGFETIPLLKSIDPLFTPQAEAAFRKMFGKDAKRTLDILAYRLGLITHVTPKTQFMSTQPEYETIHVQMPGSAKYTLKYLSQVMADFIVERTAFYRKNFASYRETYDKCIDIHRKTLKTEAQIEAFKRYTAAVKHMSANGFDARNDGELAVFTNKYEKEQIHPTLPQELRKPFIDAKSVVKYVELKVRGECLGRILTKERIQCHVDMIPHIDFPSIIKSIKKKTIIFTSYVKVVDACNAHLEKLKMKPLIVYGENSGDLVGQVKKFATDPNANPLVTTYQSLSTAVPLTMANGVIFLNNPWRSFEKDQAIARAHRIGQDEQVYGFDVVLDTGSDPNISSRSLDVMQWSKEQVDAIMGLASAGNVSVESNGFVFTVEEDINEVLEDVKWSQDFNTDIYTYKDELEQLNAPDFMPAGRSLYKTKNK